jgi:hypothetical protein
MVSPHFKQQEQFQSRLLSLSTYNMESNAMGMELAQATMIFLRSLAKKEIVVSKAILGLRIRR